MKRCTVVALLFLILPVASELTQAQGARQFRATITAYTSSSNETDSNPHITASGERTGIGTVACPHRIRFGAKVRIDGRIYECRDRLNRRMDHRFDIWMPTKAQAKQFGKRTLMVEIVED